MFLQDFYKSLIAVGKKYDHRSRDDFSAFFAERKAEFDQLDPEAQRIFDNDILSNPYADTRVLYTRADNIEINTIMVGIDIDAAELQLAQQLPVVPDLVLSHHAQGIAYANLYQMGWMHPAILKSAGVTIDESLENAIALTMQEVRYSIYGKNHRRVIDAARLLNQNFICCHTPGDNAITHYLNKNLNSDMNLQETVDFLRTHPEYQVAEALNVGPHVRNGSLSAKLGKFFVDMTGGFEGPLEVIDYLHQAEVNTLICMNISPKRFQRVSELGMNCLVAGHIASDNLGMNILLDHLTYSNPMEIISASGFTRVCRHG